MHKELMRISEFAKLSGISRKLLIFYDRCGILHPRKIDPENGYRYYSYRQMDTASVIRSLREAGMSLDAIREYLSGRTPKNLIATLEAQGEALKEQIGKLCRINEMIDARIRQTECGIAADTGRVRIVECEAENLFLGPPLPPDYDLKDGWSHLPAFYAACRKNGVQLGYTVGTMIPETNLIRGLWRQPGHYFYRLPEGRYPDFFTKPKGRYIVGTEYTDYGHTDSLYGKLLRAAEKKGLRVCGNAYEEFLIDEISEADPARYLLQIAIRVEDCRGDAP